VLREVSFWSSSVKISSRSQFRGPMSTGEIQFAGGTSAGIGSSICEALAGSFAALVADNSIVFTFADMDLAAF